MPLAMPLSMPPAMPPPMPLTTPPFWHGGQRAQLPHGNRECRASPSSALAARPSSAKPPHRLGAWSRLPPW
eukprot:11196556-Lingulodinium_polyedra.AAC.1